MLKHGHLDRKNILKLDLVQHLGDAQARRLGIRTKGEKGKYYAHTLNNTVVSKYTCINCIY